MFGNMCNYSPDIFDGITMLGVPYDKYQSFFVLLYFVSEFKDQLVLVLDFCVNVVQ